MRLFADTADLDVMESLRDSVKGFTTNPTLCRAAGVTDYEYWGREAAARFPDHALSIEVLADGFLGIHDQAKRITSWGDNVFAKVPVCLTDGRSTDPLVRMLLANGVKVNVTAVFTTEQIADATAAMRSDTPAILSIFVGRLADTGVDPLPTMMYASFSAPANVEVLWASAREAFNYYQAVQLKVSITMAPELVAKLEQRGRDLAEFSKATVQQFYDDAIAAGLTL